MLFTLLIAAAVAYLPNHIAVISNRLWYYVHGEFLYAATNGAGAGTANPSAALLSGPASKSLQQSAATAVMRSIASAEGVTRSVGEL